MTSLHLALCRRNNDHFFVVRQGNVLAPRWRGLDTLALQVARVKDAWAPPKRKKTK